MIGLCFGLAFTAASTARSNLFHEPGSGLTLSALLGVLFVMKQTPVTLPDFSESEQQSSDELLRNMGHAITAWQAVEHAVFDIYRFFFDTEHADVAAVTFFAVRTFDVRTQMTDELVSHFLTKNQKDKWAQIRTKIRKKSQRRNDAAHGLFAFYGKSPNRKAMLSKSIYDIRKFPENPREFDFTSAKELYEGAQISVIIAHEIYEFISELQQDAALPAKFRARPQRVEVNDRNNPLKAHIPLKP